MIKKTSQYWQELLTDPLEITIMDADGWDRRNYDYSYNQEEITAREFKKRLCLSTCMFPIRSLEKLELRIKEHEGKRTTVTKDMVMHYMGSDAEPEDFAYDIAKYLNGEFNLELAKEEIIGLWEEK